MRRYIVIWLVVILLVDMAAYGIMVSTGGSFIKSNVEYKKIYPCVDAYLETYYDEKTGEHEIGPSKEYYDAEPSIHESQKHSVYKYYTEIIVILDILLAGVAVFLYIIFTNRTFNLVGNVSGNNTIKLFEHSNNKEKSFIERLFGL